MLAFDPNRVFGISVDSNYMYKNDPSLTIFIDLLFSANPLFFKLKLYFKIAPIVH